MPSSNREQTTEPEWHPPFQEREATLRNFAYSDPEKHGLGVGMWNWPMFMRELFAEIDRLREELADARKWDC